MQVVSVFLKKVPLAQLTEAREGQRKFLISLQYGTKSSFLLKMPPFRAISTFVSFNSIYTFPYKIRPTAIQQRQFARAQRENRVFHHVLEHFSNSDARANVSSRPEIIQTPITKNGVW